MRSPRPPDILDANPRPGPPQARDAWMEDVRAEISSNLELPLEGIELELRRGDHGGEEVHRAQTLLTTRHPMGEQELCTRLEAPSGSPWTDTRARLAITLLRLAVSEAQHRQARAFADSLVDNLGDALLLVDRYGRIVEANPASIQLLGLPLTSLIGSSIASVLVLDDGVGLPAGLHGRVDLRPVQRLHVRLQANLHRGMLRDGAAGWIVGMTDVTALRDQELARQQAVADKTYQRLLELADAVGDLFLVWDSETLQLLDANGHARKVLGLEASELARQSIAAFLDPSSLHTEQESSSTTLVCADGSSMPTDLRLFEETRRGRSLSVALLRDMRARDALGAQRVELERARALAARAEAEMARTQRLALVGTLAAGVAHEVNNPLTFIIGNLEAALDMVEEGVIREMLQDAHDGACRIGRISQDLNAFARADDQGSAALDIHGPLEIALRMAGKKVASHTRVHFRRLATQRVVGDSDRYVQVFLNLLLNASQANAKNITVTTSDLDGQVVLDFADDGGGMDEETLERATRPFFTTKTRGTGTGLGLAVSHHIIEQLGGTLELSSQLGVGSTVRVVLRASEPINEQAPEASFRPDFAGMRILVIDDEGQVRRALGRLMRRADYVGMPGVAPALEHLARDRRFDFIFCDLVMPGLTGMDFHDRLDRVAPELADRVIYMTGGAIDPSAREFVGKHRDTMLFKPITSRDICQAMNSRADGRPPPCSPSSALGV